MSTELAVLPPSVTSRGLDGAQWNTLCNSLFPGAKADSVLMAIDYCKARGLDVMKKPCHIVPISVKDGDRWVYRDVVMPGIYEYRITAHRTKQYLGHTKPEYGDEVDYLGVLAPEWCEMTIRRYHEPTGQVIEYPQRVYFREVAATKKKDNELFVNERWSKAPIQMLTKCTEAAGLREAFPDELGGTQTDDEMHGRSVEIEATVVAEQPSEKRRSRKPEVEEPQSTSDRSTVAQSGKSASPDGGVEVAGSNPAGAADRIIKSQQTLIEQRLKRNGIPLTEFLAQFEIGHLEDLLFDDMQKASDWIANYKA